MSEVRSVLLVTGPHDVGSIGTCAVDAAASLASAGLIRPLVAGTCRALLRHAREHGLHAVDLSSLPPSSRQEWFQRTVPAVHIVHALGAEAAVSVVPAAREALLPVVVTFDGIRLGGLPRARVLGRRRPASSGASIRWLVHGRLATARMVRSGLTRADDVLTLPLLPTAVTVGGSDWAAARARARQRISLLPGTRVVVGVGPLEGPMLRRLDTALGRATAHAVGYWVSDEHGRRPHRYVSSRITVVDAAEGERVLPAMDVLVADGTAAGGVHPAVDAVRAGVPVVSGPDDLAAELITHGINGFVCAPHDVSSALDAAFVMAAAHGGRCLGPAAHGGRGRGATGELPDAAEVTARCYSLVLERSLVRPVLIGRRAAR